MLPNAPLESTSPGAAFLRLSRTSDNLCNINSTRPANSCVQDRRQQLEAALSTAPHAIVPISGLICGSYHISLDTPHFLTAVSQEKCN
eukprot:347005-Rhodomonas_salina.1